MQGYVRSGSFIVSSHSEEEKRYQLEAVVEDIIHYMNTTSVRITRPVLKETAAQGPLSADICYVLFGDLAPCARH
jgi:hypothetical protein